MGGLSTACLLSKLGKSVLVLEKHTKVGGCLHTFGRTVERDGKVEKLEFETGLH